jgi:hypothetical protein
MSCCLNMVSLRLPFLRFWNCRVQGGNMRTFPYSLRLSRVLGRCEMSSKVAKKPWLSFSSCTDKAYRWAWPEMAEHSSFQLSLLMPHTPNLHNWVRFLSSFRKALPPAALTLTAWRVCKAVVFPIPAGTSTPQLSRRQVLCNLDNRDTKLRGLDGVVDVWTWSLAARIVLLQPPMMLISDGEVSLKLCRHKCIASSVAWW